MNIFTLIFNNYGVIFFVLVSSTLIILGVQKKSKYFNQLNNSNLQVIIYIAISTLIFILIKKSYSVIYNENAGLFFNENYQRTYAIFGLNILIQFILILIPKKVFNKLLFVSVTNLILTSLILFFIGFGIISFVYFLVFTGVLAVLIFMNDAFTDLKQIIADNQDSKILEFVKEDLNKYLKISFQGLLGLGASLGVSMSILFRGGEDAWGNKEYLINGIAMVVAFGSVSLGIIIWVLKPYLENFKDVRNYYVSSIKNNGVEHQNQ